MARKVAPNHVNLVLNVLGELRQRVRKPHALSRGSLRERFSCWG